MVTVKSKIVILKSKIVNGMTNGPCSTSATDNYRVPDFAYLLATAKKDDRNTVIFKYIIVDVLINLPID